MTTTRERLLAAAGITVAVFVLYLLTLSPTTAMWDAGEYIAAAKSLGIPHQPGNPFYVVVAHAAGLIPLSANYALRINVLAALCGAVTAGLWFLVAERLLRAVVEPRLARLAAAAGASLLGATAFTVWNQSVVMEKVYPLALTVLALVSWIVLKWMDERDSRRADSWLTLAAYLVGLGYAVHPAGLLTLPAIGMAVLRHRPAILRRPAFLARLALVAGLGLTPFAVLPIRAAYQPYINESAVSACEDGKLAASCTFSSETARRLMGTINREQYGGNPVLVRRAPFSAQVGMFWLYFKWQWMRDLSGQWRGTQSIIAAIMMVAGIVGLTSLRSKSGDPRERQAANGDRPHDAWFWYFGTLTLTFTVALIYYLNFRYGWSQSPQLGNEVPREPRDRDYFYMWTFSLWGLMAGLGIISVLRRRAAIVLALALVPLAANWSSASRRGMAFTREWAADMLNTVEPNAVIITMGDNDSFPLWYAQSVEGMRPDVAIALTPYLGMDWYARQLNRRSKLWELTNQELDTVPPIVEFRQPMAFTHGTIAATIPPGVFTRDQLLVLRAIKDSFPTRPIYFAFNGYAQALGLGPYLKRVGLLEKLEAHPVVEGPDTVRTPTGMMDLPKSLALWENTYRGAKQMVREGHWVDGSSAGVPLYYAALGQDIAVALSARGDTARAQRVIELARQAAEAASR